MKTTGKALENKEIAMETKAPEEIKVPKEAKAQEGRIYIGPMLKGVAMPGTVYNGDLPQALNDAIAATPVIKELVVPISRLIDANKKLADPNSALSRFYELANKQERGTN